MMNYVMGALRVFIGFAAGAIIILFTTSTILGKPIITLFESNSVLDNWRGAALLGFLGGFAERLVPFLLGKLENGAEGLNVDERNRPTSRGAVSVRSSVNPAAQKPADQLSG
jgi:hypothetical protein